MGTQRTKPESDQQPGIVKVVFAATAGTVLEWYDYFLYGATAALVFDQLFFPGSAPLIGTLLAFATFGVGFLGRPLGAIIFGHIGDRRGRIPAFRVSLVLAGVATVAIGLLPTYDTIGVFAPLLLVTLRFLQGIGLGGEYGGAAVLMAENARVKRRGISSCWAQWAAPVGQLLSLAIVGFFSARLSSSQFETWGWRVPFLLSFILVAFGYYLRLKMADSKEFLEDLEDAAEHHSSPIRQIMTSERKPLLITIGSRISSDVALYVISVFVLTYITVELDLSRDIAIRGIIIGNIVQIAVIPVFAALGDRIGRKPVYFLGAVGAALWGGVFFLLLDTKQTPLITLAICGGLGFQAVISAGHPAFHVEQFRTPVRYSGVSIGYQLGGIVGGGFAPMIAVALLAYFGSWVPVCLYLALAAAVTVVAVTCAKERNRTPLSDI